MGSNFFKFLFIWAAWICSQANAYYVPYPVQSKVSNEANQRASLVNSGSCSVGSSSGSWISATSRTGAGTCVWGLSGFRSAPTCVCTPNYALAVCTIVSVNTTSVTTTTTLGNSASDTDMNLWIECQGPK